MTRWIWLTVAFASLCSVGHGQSKCPFQHSCSKALNIPVPTKCAASNTAQQILNTVDLDEDVLLVSAFPSFGYPALDEQRSNWTVICNKKPMSSECNSVIDGLSGTFWSANISTYVPGWSAASVSIELDVQKNLNINALSIRPRVGAHGHGAVGGHYVYLSIDGVTWGDPVSFGTWSSEAVSELHYTNGWRSLELKVASSIRHVQTSEGSLRTI